MIGFADDPLVIRIISRSDLQFTASGRTSVLLASTTIRNNFAIVSCCLGLDLHISCINVICERLVSDWVVGLKSLLSVSTVRLDFLHSCS